MKTKFTKRILSALLSLLMVVTMLPTYAITASAADSEKFLFAYFTGNGTAGTGANTQEIRFATSTDGINFTPLLNNNSAIMQRGGTGNVRDPFIFKGHDGFYYIVGTDLNATTMGFWGNQPQIVFWKSADLITWTDETYINTAQICGLNNNQVQRTWAPEVIWDDALGKYMVYFAFAADGYNSTTMYYMTTSDLLDQSKYSQPQQLFAPGGDAIDADIVKQDSTYYMFYKDETEGRKNVCLATASSVTGPYTYQGVFGTSSQTGAIEGCEVFMIGANYHLVADRYGDNGKFAIYNLGTDLSKLTGKATINMTDGNPVKTVNATTGYSNLSARHGSIIHISDDQYNAFKNNAPHSVGQEVAVNGSGIASQIQPNLVAHYLISSGDQKPDFSGHNHNANTLDTTNTVWQNSGNYPYSGVTNIQGLYFKLNNEHDYFKAPVGDMFSQTNLDQGITISFMAKPDTGIDDVHSHFFEIISTSGNITWDGEAKTAHQYIGWFTSGNVEVVTSRRDLNGGSYANFGTRTAEKDAWHTYTLTLKRDEVKAYIDGELVGSTTANANAMLWNGLTGSDAVLRIGNTAWPDNDYKGYMRDFRIYNKALSEEEASQMGATHKTFAQNQATADAVAGIYAAQNNQFKGTVVPKANNTECYNGYANVLYSSNTWVDGNSGTKYQQVYDGTSNNYLMPAMLGMSDIVLLYDGKNDTAFPIIFKCQINNKSGCTNRYRWDYIASEHADWTLAKNNQTLINAKGWNTFQTSSKEFSISTNTSNETNTGNNNNNKCEGEWPWQGACYFQGSFAENSYSKTYTNTISFKGQCDIRITWGISGKQWNENKMYTDMRYGTSGSESKTVRVVNYKPIADKMDAVIKKFDDVRKVQNPNYGAAELKEYYEAVAVVTKNPNSFFKDSNFSTNISNYETWIKQALGTPMTRALEGPRAHSFAYTTISEATCTDAGLQKVTCSNTGCDYEKLQTVAALGHIKASAETKANEVDATCEAAGSYDMQYLCTRCSAVLSSRTVSVNPTGHNYTGEYYLTYTTDSLADADVTYQHYQKCANNEAHTNPTGCSWVPAPELKVDATAEQQGKEYEKCSVCGGTRYTVTTYNAVKYNITFTMEAGYGEEARSQTIEVEEGQTPVAPFTLPNTKYHYDTVNEYSYSWPALAAATEDTEYVAIVSSTPHAYKAVVTDPTCGVGGYTTYTCINAGCGDSYVADYTDPLVHNYGAWTSDAAGHHKKVCLNDCGDVIQEDCEYTKTTTDPTCTADGYDEYTCQTCNHSYKETIDKLGHDIQTVFVKSTCTEDGYFSTTCTRGDMTGSEKYTMAGIEYRDYDPNTTAYVDWQGSSYDNKVQKFTLSIGAEIDHIDISYKQTYNNHVGGNTVRWRLRDGNGTEIVADSVNQSILSGDKYIERTVTVTGNSFTVEAPDFGNNDKIQFLSIKVYPKMPAGWTDADLTKKGHDYHYINNNDGADGLLGTHRYVCSRCNDGADVNVEHDLALNRVDNTIVASCKDCDFSQVLHTTANTITLTQNNLFDTDKFINSYNATETNKTSGGYACFRRTDGKVVVVGNGDNYTGHDRENDYLIPVEGGKTYQFDFDASTTYGDVMLFFRGAGNGYDSNFLNMRKSGTTVGTNTIEFTVPEGGKQLYIRVGTNNSGAKNAYCVYSNFALHEKDDPNYKMIKDLPQGTAIDDYFTPATADVCHYNFMNSTIIKADGTMATGTTVDRNANVVVVTAHTEVSDNNRVEPTCVNTGLTASSHCSVCGYLVKAQETIEATGNHSYTGESVHTDADGEANGYTEYRCVNGCNELGGRVYDTQNWDAYDAQLAVVKFNTTETAKYTKESIDEYKKAVDAITATVDKDDVTKSQAYIDAKVRAIDACKSKLFVATYKVTFEIVDDNDKDDDPIYSHEFDPMQFGELVPLSLEYYFKNTFGDSNYTEGTSIATWTPVKWTKTEVVGGVSRDVYFGSNNESINAVISGESTFTVYVKNSAPADTDKYVSVTMYNNANKVTDIKYLEKDFEYDYTINGGEITIGDETFTAAAYSFYTVNGFSFDENAVVYAPSGKVTFKDNAVIKPKYMAKSSYTIKLGDGVDIDITKYPEKQISAGWNQSFTLKAVGKNTVWMVGDVDGENFVTVAKGDTFTFRATKSCTIKCISESSETEKPIAVVDYLTYGDYRDKTITAVGRFYVPEGYTFYSSGMLLKTDVNSVDNVLDIDVLMANYKTGKGKFESTVFVPSTNQYTINVYASKAYSKIFVGAIAYVECINDKTGKTEVFFSDEVTTFSFGA